MILCKCFDDLLSEHCKMEEKDGKQVMRCMWSHSGQDDYDDIPHAWTQTHESVSQVKLMIKKKGLA